jgi:rSAM/selenodomain-associated transferase 1
MADGRRGPDSRPLLIIMLKAPVMGRVKTRLAREIGLAAATRFARISARITIQRLSRDRRWRTLLAVAPDNAVGAQMWPAHCRKIGQGRGDLGARMGRLLGPAFRPALLIGADIPGVSPAMIADAFALLRRNDIVLGPAEDGGYWLIGMNRGAPQVVRFQGVRWSTPYALDDTVACFPASRIGFAAALGDVDDAESYRRHAALAGCVTLQKRRTRRAWL